MPIRRKPWQAEYTIGAVRDHARSRAFAADPPPSTVAASPPRPRNGLTVRRVPHPAHGRCGTEAGFSAPSPVAGKRNPQKWTMR